MKDAFRGKWYFCIRTWLTADIRPECVLDFISLIRQHVDSTDELLSLLHNLPSASPPRPSLRLHWAPVWGKSKSRESGRQSISIILLHPGYLASHRAHSFHPSPSFLLCHFFISPVFSFHHLPVVLPQAPTLTPGEIVLLLMTSLDLCSAERMGC